MAVILDVVRRYDIDGIHIDDYFYPYKEKDDAEKLIPFPDDDTWAAYQKAGGKLARDDWRRDAVNRFVERMYRETKKAKPWVKVGISPFGIWRPGHPPGIAGLDQYAELFADAKLWFNEGWCDYYCPQLYWPIAQEKQSYPKLLAWWVGENKKGRHLWPGNYTSRVTGKEKGWPASEVAEQIRVTRAQKGATGNVHFSTKALLNNPGGVADAIKEVYKAPALVPAVEWGEGQPPAAPTLTWDRTKEGERLAIRAGDKTVVRFFVVRTKEGVRVIGADERGEARLTWASRPEGLRVTALDRNGIEGMPGK